MSQKPYFENDGITIYHGDCREVLRELPSGIADLVLTDPPYLVSYSGRWGSDWGVIQGDSDPSWVAPAYLECWRVLKDDSPCITFYGWPHADTFMTTWKLIGFRPVSVLVLIKDRIGLGQFTRAQHEHAYVLAKGEPPKPAAAISDVLRWETTAPLFHPNQKPLGAFSKIVTTYSAQDSLVIDPFCGTGTTLVAARASGRRAIGIEIEERHCELAAMRLSQTIMDFHCAERRISCRSFSATRESGVPKCIYVPQALTQPRVRVP